MQPVPPETTRACLEAGQSVRPAAFEFLPDIADLVSAYGEARFPFAAVVCTLNELRAAAARSDVTHLIVRFRITAASQYVMVMVPHMRFKRLVVLMNVTQGVADIFRGMMPGVVVLVGASLIDLPCSVRRLHDIVAAHQQQTDEADLRTSAPEPMQMAEPLHSFRPSLPRCLISGCGCAAAAVAASLWRAPPSAHDVGTHLVCNWCGHAAGKHPKCRLCGCGICDVCLEKDPARLRCSCMVRPAVFDTDLVSQVLAAQFVLDRELLRGDNNIVFSAHLADSPQLPAQPSDRWDRSPPPQAGGGGGGVPGDRINVVATRIHVLKMLAPLLQAPGLLPPVRTVCAGGAAFLVYAFGGHRVGEGPPGDYQLAVALQTLWTLATVCGSLQACQLMYADLALADFVVERDKHGRLSVRLQLTGSAPQRVQTTLQHACKLRLSRLMGQLADMIARLAGPTLAAAARGFLRDLVGFTAFVAGTFPASLGGGQFDVAELESKKLGIQTANTGWLVLVANHVSEVLNTPLRTDDAVSAGVWADTYRAP